MAKIVIIQQGVIQALNEGRQTALIILNLELIFYSILHGYTFYENIENCPFKNAMNVSKKHN